MKQPGRLDLSILDIPHPVQVTSGQVDLLLRTIATLTNCITAQRIASMDQTENAVQGEERIAAENTFIKACERLDTVLDDASRWNNDFQKVLEQKAGEIHAADLELRKAQAEAAAEINSPHFQYKPNIQRLDTGGWVAYVGDPNLGDDSIAGIGRSPQAAIDAFDQVFRGTIPAHMIQWLLQRQAALSEGKIPPEAPNTNTNAKKAKMDRNRNRKTRHPAKDGKDGGGNPS